jgi:flavin-binding protein dodecin
VSTIVKVIEVIAQSDKGFDDAVRNAVVETAKTVNDIKSVWISNLECVVDGTTITQFRANAKISFLVHER